MFRFNEQLSGIILKKFLKILVLLHYALLFSGISQVS